MDVKLIKNTKTELEIALPGESHSICNILSKYLMEDETVNYAVYGIDHPLIGDPVISIKVANKKSHKKALITANNKIKNNTLELKKLIESIED
ncbi:MAG: DNA-directed RNA polymerase subunit L [Methanobrevibacter sp.]|jgi:DNA-directed RNA polymerase subunit L|nr:DNA-directed RNA polymerase subunit L [Methanobrevibacter sp.]